ncbi:MAG: hypothetical protein M5R41_19180 [Bacteroidia bacterium]|nr:hypothetical protein [Bacteroidia bacterium]
MSTTATDTATTTEQQAPLGGLRPQDINLSDAQYEQPGGRERALENTSVDWLPNDPLLAFLNDSTHPNQDTGLHPSSEEPFAIPRPERDQQQQTRQFQTDQSAQQTQSTTQTQQTAPTAAQQSTQQTPQGETLEGLKAQLA